MAKIRLFDSSYTLILNDGRIAIVKNNSLIIYNKYSFKEELCIKAKEEIFNISQLQNNNLIIIFEYFFMVCRLIKNNIHLIQKISFDNFPYDQYNIIKGSPEIIELSNIRFIIKLTKKEYSLDLNSYADFRAPTLTINIYEYDKISKKYFFKNMVVSDEGQISRILDTFIIHTKYGSVDIYRHYRTKYDNPLYTFYHLRRFIEGGGAYQNTTSTRHYVWENKYLLFYDLGKVDIYEFDNDYKENKIREIKNHFFPLRDCRFYYNSQKPVFFYSSYGRISFSQFNENLEEIKNEKNYFNLYDYRINDIKIINSVVYILYNGIIYLLNKK